MAIIWAEGFEDDATDDRGTAPSVDLNTTWGLGGRRGARVGDTHNAFVSSPLVPVTSGGENSIWFHFKIYIVTAFDIYAYFHVLGGDTQMSLRKSSGQFYLDNYNGAADTAAFGTRSTDVWYEFFIEKVYHASTGTFKVWINGSLEVNLSGLNTGTIPSTTDMQMGGTGGVDVDSMYVMDMVIGDGSDSPSSSFPYSLQAHTLLPDGNGNTSGLTGSDGNSTDNYLLVDESDPDTADYCGSATEGDKDTYSMGDLSSTTEAIVGVIGEALSAKSDSGTKFMRPVIRTSSTDYNGDSEALSETYVMQFHVWDDNPNTANAWTGTEVNAIEMGAEVRDS